MPGKTSLRLVLVAIVGGLPALTACGDGDASPPAALPSEAPKPSSPSVGAPTAAPPDAGAPDARVDTTASSKIAAHDAALASAVCARLEACCSSADYDTFFGQFTEKPYESKTPPDRADCATSLAATFGKLHQAKWGASVARGRIAFDEARGKKCAADVAAAACGVPLTNILYDAACFGIRGSAVFKKTNPVGAACDDIGDTTFNGECDPALGYCGSAKTCEAWRGPGQDCSVTPERKFCSGDLACDGLRPNAPGKCSAAPITRSVGEECLAISGPFIECPPNAYCDFGTRLCTLKKADGAACQSDDECTSFHPFSCAPFGNGTCGSAAFCSGRQPADGGAR